MWSSFITECVESRAFYRRESKSEGKKEQSEQLKIERRKLSDEIQRQPANDQKSGSNRQHHLECFDRQLPSQNHEAENADLQSDDETHTVENIREGAQEAQEQNTRRTCFLHSPNRTPALPDVILRRSFSLIGARSIHRAAGAIISYG